MRVGDHLGSEDADRSVGRLGRLHLRQPLVSVRSPPKKYLGDNRNDVAVFLGMDGFSTRPLRSLLNRVAVSPA